MCSTFEKPLNVMNNLGIILRSTYIKMYFLAFFEAILMTSCNAENNSMICLRSAMVLFHHSYSDMGGPVERKVEFSNLLFQKLIKSICPSFASYPVVTVHSTEAFIFQAVGAGRVAWHPF